MSDPDISRSLNLGLLGYGNMGKIIAALAQQRAFCVSTILDENSNRDYQGITAENFKNVDVAVDFTIPGAVVENIRRVAALGCNIVVGTTGWMERLDEVRSAIESAGTGLVYAANFSIGVQLFYRAARALARTFSGFPGYEPYIMETHHRLKKDAPSGTALELKRQVQPALGAREVSVASVRAGYIPGTHEIGFDSAADTVILRHTARSRQGFAEGALYAARWVMGKRGVFEFADVLNTVMNDE
jgi:4-hydroxy-tetrahydrodipicolinate reductase